MLCKKCDNCASRSFQRRLGQLIIPHVLVAQLNLYVDNFKGNELI